MLFGNIGIDIDENSTYEKFDHVLEMELKRIRDMFRVEFLRRIENGTIPTVSQPSNQDNG